MKNLKLSLPATSANLGPGFDCLGLSWQRFDHFFFSFDIERPIRPDDPDGFEGNLVLRSYQSFGRRFRTILPHPSLRIEGDIPSARGLGSSAACILAGLLAAAYSSTFYPEEAEDGGSYRAADQLDPPLLQGVFNLASQLEGHPDNIAPCLYGGLRLSRLEEGKALSAPLPLCENLSYILFLPSLSLPTPQARQALPENYARRDAVSNLASLAFLLEGLRTGREDLLRQGLRDTIHQPYRFPLIPHGLDLVDQADQAGALGTVISGAGPSLLSILPKALKAEDFLEQLGRLPAGWKAQPLQPDFEGARFQVG